MTGPATTGKKKGGQLGKLNNTVSKKDNGAKGGGTVKTCDWRLRVKIISDEPIWPKAAVNIKATRTAGNSGPNVAPANTTLKAKQGKPVEVTTGQNGDATYTLTA